MRYRAKHVELLFSDSINESIISKCTVRMSRRFVFINLGIFRTVLGIFPISFGIFLIGLGIFPTVLGILQMRIAIFTISLWIFQSV